MATHSSILAWEILMDKEPVGYSPWDHNEWDTTKATEGAYSRLVNKRWYQAAA